MDKEKLGEYLVQSATLLREVSKERDELKTKIARMELDARIDKIAEEMKARSINEHLSEEEMRSDLAKQAEDGRLDMIEKALSWSSGGNSNFSGFHSVAEGTMTKASQVSGANVTSLILTGMED
jgi:hypothetical protein